MRGQAHTLEAFTAALIVLMAVVFAFQATAVTPLTASTASQHIENQERQMADGLLAAADANGTLRAALLHWNNSSDAFVGVPDRGYFVRGGPAGTAFGDALNETFGDERIAFNVYVYSFTANDTVRQTTVVYMGDPSDNAVAATHTVVLYDDAHLVGPYASIAVADSSLYAPDAAPDSPLYNVLEVKLVVWQM